MNYTELLRKRDLYQSGRSSIPELTLQSYEQAFEILKNAYGLVHKDVGIAAQNLALTYEQLHHEKEATQYQAMASSIFQKVFHGTKG